MYTIMCWYYIGTRCVEKNVMSGVARISDNSN